MQPGGSGGVTVTTPFSFAATSSPSVSRRSFKSYPYTGKLGLPSFIGVLSTPGTALSTGHPDSVCQ